jgi:hypothetical protein
MAVSDNEAPPTRGPQHEALAVFLGNWRAEGVSYGSPKQTAENPTATAEPWKSTHTARWHTGKFFLVQDERATTGPNPFDTLSVMGVDADTGKYFARCFENHGFYRRYNVSVSGRVWTFDGEYERARYEFSADGNTQIIVWEWRPRDVWLPLCQRTAVRV